MFLLSNSGKLVIVSYSLFVAYISLWIANIVIIAVGKIYYSFCKSIDFFSKRASPESGLAGRSRKLLEISANTKLNINAETFLEIMRVTLLTFTIAMQWIHNDMVTFTNTAENIYYTFVIWKKSFVIFSRYS